MTLQEKTNEKSTKGTLEVRQELVSNPELSTADKKSEIEETLEHMTLEEIDQPSTSAES